MYTGISVVIGGYIRVIKIVKYKSFLYFIRTSAKENAAKDPKKTAKKVAIEEIIRLFSK